MAVTPTGITVESLYNAYKTDIFRFALAMVRNVQDAQDITGEVFCKAHEKLHRLRDAQKAKVWLLSIARNLAVDMYRRRAPVNIYRQPPEPQTPGPFEFVQVVECLALPDRQIVTLRFVGGLTHDEIAKVLHMTSAQVRKRYSRALQKIKLFLEEDHE